MKLIIILTAGLILSFSATSQNIILTPKQARQVIRDVEEGKILARENDMLLQLVNAQDGKMSVKDSLIANYGKTFMLYEQRDTYWQQRETQHEGEKRVLKKRLRRANFRTIVAGAVIAAMTYFAITN